jgi:hypothetical protein
VNMVNEYNHAGPDDQKVVISSIEFISIFCDPHADNFKIYYLRLHNYLLCKDLGVRKSRL